MKFKWYDRAGEEWGISPRKVAAIVKKHNLTKRKIYGIMAVDSIAFNKVMEQSGYRRS